MIQFRAAEMCVLSDEFDFECSKPSVEKIRTELRRERMKSIFSNICRKCNSNHLHSAMFRLRRLRCSRHHRFHCSCELAPFSWFDYSCNCKRFCLHIICGHSHEIIGGGAFSIVCSITSFGTSASINRCLDSAPKEGDSMLYAIIQIQRLPLKLLLPNKEVFSCGILIQLSCTLYIRFLNKIAKIYSTLILITSCECS